MTVTTPLPSPRRDELEALIEEARRRARRRRRRAGLALGLVLLAAAVAFVLGTRGDGAARSSHGGAPISVAPAPRAIAPEQAWYTRTTSTWRASRPAGGEYQGRIFMRARGPIVAFDVEVSRETWVGVDGSVRERTVVLSARFASPAAQAQWARYNRPLPSFAHDIDSDSIALGSGRLAATGSSGNPQGPQDIGDGAFTYAQLLSLPSEPTALRARIDRAFAALAQRAADSALNPCGWGGVTGCPPPRPVSARQHRDDLAGRQLVEIGQMLTWPVPAHLRLALSRAATTLSAVTPDVRVNRHARDALGRSGVAITFSPPRQRGEYASGQMRLIVAPGTGELLAQPGFGVQGVVTAQGVASSVRRLPPGVSEVPLAGGPPSPPVANITPPTGKPDTVFTVKVTASPSLSGVGGSVSGPVYPGCTAGFNAPGPPTPPPWLSFAGTLTSHGAGRTNVYRLTPPTGTGHVWCRGRYELTVFASALGPSSASDTGTTSLNFEVG